MQTLEIVKAHSAGLNFFTPLELSPMSDGLTIRDLLVKKHGWSQEQLGSQSAPYKIDVDANINACVRPHATIIKNLKSDPNITPIKQILAPGRAILFDKKGVKLANFWSFFSHGFKAFDQLTWRNLIIEGLNNATFYTNSEQLNYHDTYDRWWYITETRPTTFCVYGFSHKITIEFPYLVLTSADFVRIKDLSDAEIDVWNGWIAAKHQIDERGSDIVLDAFFETFNHGLHKTVPSV